MAIRVQSTTAKAGVIVSGAVITAITGFAVAFASASPLAPAATLIPIIALVVFCTRLFRGAHEAVEPARPWWKATATPLWGYILALVFLGHGITTFLQWTAGTQQQWSVLTSAVYVIVGLYFASSSLRLGQHTKTA